jgi:alanine dehydrogenase
MSEIAGRLAIQAGMRGLEMKHGGRGVLLSGVPGVAPGKVVILGGGMVGANAARIAVGLGADVTLLDRNADRLRQFDDLYGGRLKTRFSNPANIAECVTQADLVVGAAYVHGRRAPRLLTRDLIRAMPRGAALVDVSIDQGGIAETSHATTHSALLRGGRRGALLRGQHAGRRVPHRHPGPGGSHPALPAQAGSRSPRRLGRGSGLRRA